MDSWARRGISLLWGGSALGDIVSPAKVVSIHGFFSMAPNWPSELPGADGNALVVAGLDACLDCLTPDDGELWLEEDLKPQILSFQDEFQGSAALVFWLPPGRKRVHMNRASEQYYWACAGSHQDRTVPLGRCLWAGAESDVRRIIIPVDGNTDPDGLAWIGLNHPRIS